MKKNLWMMLAACSMVSVGKLPARSLVFTLNDGQQVYYRLGGSVNPVMTFVDGHMQVNADVYEFSDIRNFYISMTDAPTGIGQTVAGGTCPSFNGSVLLVRQSGEVAVYTSDGRKAGAVVTCSGDCTSVDLSALVRGVYVVKVGGSSFKVNKK
ncbi:MAG: hypothetical protein NC388_01265 [Clostridium sp.]|nr:hypothetical protein [Clostridium sp.]